MEHVHPMAAPFVAKVCLALRDLVGVVGERVVDTATMDVAVFAKVLHSDAGAFNVPSGIADSPGARPLELLIVELRLCEPKHEVGAVALVAVSLNALAHANLEVFLVEVVESVVGFELGCVKINISARLVSVTLFDKGLDDADEVVNAGCCGLDDVGNADVQLLAVGKESVGVELRDLHDRLLLALCALEHFVVARVAVAGQMSDVGDVHNALDLVARVAQIAVKDVLHHIGAEVSDMSIVINGGAAGIDRNLALLAGLELIAAVCQRIIEDHLFYRPFGICLL